MVQLRGLHDFCFYFSTWLYWSSHGLAPSWTSPAVDMCPGPVLCSHSSSTPVLRGTHSSPSPFSPLSRECLGLPSVGTSLPPEAIAGHNFLNKQTNNCPFQQKTTTYVFHEGNIYLVKPDKRYPDGESLLATVAHCLPGSWNEIRIFILLIQGTQFNIDSATILFNSVPKLNPPIIILPALVLSDLPCSFKNLPSAFSSPANQQMRSWWMEWMLLVKTSFTFSPDISQAGAEAVRLFAGCSWTAPAWRLARCRWQRCARPRPCSASSSQPAWSPRTCAGSCWGGSRPGCRSWLPAVCPVCLLSPGGHRRS